MSAVVSKYAVPDDLPMDGFAPGTNVLVAGPAMDAGQLLGLRLVRHRAESEGSLVVTTDTGSSRLLALYERRYGEWPRAGSAFVDCASREGSGAGLDVPVRTLSSPGDLTGIGISYSALVEGLYEENRSRIRLGLFSLNTLLMYSDVRTVFRFGHTVAGRVASTDGLGVFLVDPSTQDETVVDTVSQFLDGRIDVREGDDGAELRCRGQVDGPDSWTAF